MAVNLNGLATCTQCDEEKPVSEFARNNRRKGHYSYCKACGRLKSKAWHQANREWRKAYDRKRDLQRKHGISLEQYEQMYATQDGRCGICRQRETNAAKDPLSVDHDHRTGAVRGLLCDACNRGIGLLRDDPDVLATAIAYLSGRLPWL